MMPADWSTDVTAPCAGAALTRRVLWLNGASPGVSLSSTAAVEGWSTGPPATSSLAIGKRGATVVVVVDGAGGAVVDVVVDGAGGAVDVVVEGAGGAVDVVVVGGAALVVVVGGSVVVVVAGDSVVVV